MHSQEDLLYNTILIACSLICTVILGFVLSIIRQQRIFSRLNLRRVEIEINTLESERKRIAGDLHDELGPALSAIKYRLEALEGLPSPDQLQVEQCAHLINQIITKIRSISNDIMPAPLMLHNGIVLALSEFINTVNHGPKLEIIFNYDDIPEIPASRCIHIFRILQEIIHNTLKHAQADTLKIELVHEKEKLIILTADNGRGFDTTNTLQYGKGFGLRNLENRVTLLGGELQIRSLAGEGTSFHISLPMHKY